MCNVTFRPGGQEDLFLRHLGINPYELATPWSEFICDCMFWVRQATGILESEFTQFDFDDLRVPTGYNTLAVGQRGAELASERFRAVAKVYELRGRKMPLTYDYTPRVDKNWATFGQRVRAMLPKYAPPALLAGAIKISPSELENMLAWGAGVSDMPPSEETIARTAAYLGVAPGFLTDGILPDPERRPLDGPMTDYLLGIRQENYASLMASRFIGKDCVFHEYKKHTGVDLSYADHSAAERAHVMKGVYMLTSRQQTPSDYELRAATRRFLLKPEAFDDERK